MPASDPSLIPFFSPRGVVVVGASHDPTKLGYGLTRNLIQSGYRGAIHLVNVRGGMLHGRPVFRSLVEVPDPADLAVLLVPAASIPDTLQECAQRSIHAAIIASGGFRESGAEGAALEEECLRIARQHHIRLLGPNCIGIIDTHLPIDTTFLSPPGPTPGDVAFISHSGAICAAVNDWARGQGFGISLLVSLGNQADVNETDVLAPVAADEHTRVLTLYLEGVSNGRRFIEQAHQVARQKPILALKVGRFEGGQRAVASHTGALAGQESAFNAAFRRAGVIRVNTSEELFDLARALAWCPMPRGRNVAILTNAGGPGVTAADAVEAVGLSLAELSPETRVNLRSILGPAASVSNPVDMLAAASPQLYESCLRILLEDPQVHSIMVILPPPPMHTAGGIAKAIIPAIYTAEKPVVIALMGERLIQEAVEYFRAAHVPEYRFPERAATALEVLAQRSEALARATTEDPAYAHLDEIHPELVVNLLDSVADFQLPQSHFIPQEITTQILEAYGIRVPGEFLAHSPEEAAERAVILGFPVALKVVSPDIPHKSDVGAVRLGLADPQAVVESYARLLESVQQARPQAVITGVLVQQMIPSGQDVIVGAVQDAQFGALLMFGSGGVEVEGIKDVDFSLAPLNLEEAERLLQVTWAGRKLNGYRNLPPADRPAVIQVLFRIGQLAADFPRLAEIEINPLRVLQPGQGCFALDIRARLGD